MKNWLKGLTSRKFILAVIGAIVAFGNSAYGWGLSSADVATVLAPLIGFIFAEGAADVAGRLKSAQAADPVDFAQIMAGMDNDDYDSSNKSVVPGEGL